MNLRPSGYEPNVFGGFLPYIEMVDTWWTALINLILGGQLVDSKKWFKNRTFYPSWGTNVGLR